jgi:hypothetical protein
MPLGRVSTTFGQRLLVRGERDYGRSRAVARTIASSYIEANGQGDVYDDRRRTGVPGELSHHGASMVYSAQTLASMKGDRLVRHANSISPEAPELTAQSLEIQRAPVSDSNQSVTPVNDAVTDTPATQVAHLRDVKLAMTTAPSGDIISPHVTATKGWIFISAFFIFILLVTLQIIAIWFATTGKLEQGLTATGCSPVFFLDFRPIRSRQRR